MYQIKGLMWAGTVEGQLLRRVVSCFGPQGKVWIDRGDGKADFKKEGAVSNDRE